MKYIPLILFLSCIFIPFRLYCQTTGSRNLSINLPTIALVDVEPIGPINLNFSTPNEAGLPIMPPTVNNSKWLNYTSAIMENGASRRITASVNQTIPGVAINLLIGPPSGSAAGVLGSSAGQLTLGTTPVVIVSGIGGAFTGTGANNGHQLNFSLTTTNYADLSALTGTTIVVNYTILE